MLKWIKRLVVSIIIGTAITFAYYSWAARDLRLDGTGFPAHFLISMHRGGCIVSEHNAYIDCAVASWMVLVLYSAIIGIQSSFLKRRMSTHARNVPGENASFHVRP
jgi:hypothetical protein